MFNRLGSRGGTLRIAAGCRSRAAGDRDRGNRSLSDCWPSPVPRRPRLRFRPSQVRAALAGGLDRDAQPSLRLASPPGYRPGRPDQETSRTDRLAAAGLLPGTELTMTDCTLTVAVDRPGAALFVVQPESPRRSRSLRAGRRRRARSSAFATASSAPGARESPLRPAAGSTSSCPMSLSAPKAAWSMPSADFDPAARIPPQ